ncbi:hypothetical protein ABZ896_29000 [Streptomyces sp. NPDC047072]|uniref:hypothetical protein n=1 Tax=Streptomyces sp. NPDC047072 TaxID=3154809 RepID=UPI0033E68CE7
MRADVTSGHAVGFLLRLIDAGTADRVRARIGLPRPASKGLTQARRQLTAAPPWGSTAVPSSVLLWVLEEDDPDLNFVVWQHRSTDSGLRRAVLRGEPFGPDGSRSVRVHRSLRHHDLRVPEPVTRLGLVGALREVTTMGIARETVTMVTGRGDWVAVAEADHEQPLPGYARWALSVRPDCPPALRERFGSHAKFTHRVRQAGVLAGPAEYTTSHSPAAHVLKILSLGHVMFPARVRQAEDALRPLVREHLGDREEAWAVLAQLVDTFHGTAPELVVTAGAIA